MKVKFGTAKLIKILVLAGVFIILYTVYAYLYDKLLDKIKGSNNSVIFQRISQEISNLGIEDLINKENRNRNINQTCAWYPMFPDLEIHNNYWQEYHNTNISFHLFGAYLDKRPTVVGYEPVVHILTIIEVIKEFDEEYPLTYCQFWYEEQREPLIVLSAENNFGHFVICPLPEDYPDWIPRTVSLVASPCDKATNNVRVTYFPLKDDEVRQGFAVCIKGFEYQYLDISHQLVEYIETLRSLGAGKITIYNSIQVHPNMTKILNYYENTDFIEYHSYISVLSHKLDEIVSYNDCLYRNMYKYQYVAVVDVDEVIMPLGNLTSWHELMEFGETIKDDPYCKKFASFCFRGIHFPRYPEKPRYTDEFPEYFYMLQHVERVREHIVTDSAIKCLHNTDRVISIDKNFPLLIAPDVCNYYLFNSTDAYLQRYREPDIKENLDVPVVDKNLWRFKDEIIERSMKVFEELEPA